MIEVLKQALEVLEASVDLVQNEFDTNWRHGIPTRQTQLDYEAKMLQQHKDSITNLRAAIEQMEKVEPIGSVGDLVDDCVMPTLEHMGITAKTLLYTAPVAPEYYQRLAREYEKGLAICEADYRKQAAWVEKAKAYLEMCCGDLCNAEYNPCEAREILKELP